MYDYTPWQWLLIFYVYCFCGWVFESIVVSVQQRRPVNRGFLKGPMLPIYGFGATIMLHVSLPLMGHPAAIYFAGLVTATAFEYVVGVLMEALFKIKYWDYSDHRFQFQGRICLDSSIAWGFLSLLLAYVLHKPVADFIVGLSLAAVAAIDGVISVWFIYDTAVSAKAAFEFADALTEMEKLRAEAEEIRVQLQLGVYEAQDRIDELRTQVKETQEQLRERAAASQEQLRVRVELSQEELRQRLESAGAELRERLAAREADERTREHLRHRLAAAEEAFAERTRRKDRHYRALLRRNPSARAPRFRETLRLWRERQRAESEEVSK